MIKVKKERLEDLKKLGFENKLGLFYAKKLRASEIMINMSGLFYLNVSEFVFDDFISEITRISQVLLSDRHEVDIMLDILREKGMLEDE